MANIFAVKSKVHPLLHHKSQSLKLTTRPFPEYAEPGNTQLDSRYIVWDTLNSVQSVVDVSITKVFM